MKILVFWRRIRLEPLFFAWSRSLLRDLGRPEPPTKSGGYATLVFLLYYTMILQRIRIIVGDAPSLVKEPNIGANFSANSKKIDALGL